MANYVEERSPLWNWAAGSALAAGAAGTLFSSLAGVKAARGLDTGSRIRGIAERAGRLPGFMEPTRALNVAPEITELTESLLNKTAFKPGSATYSYFRQNLYETTYRSLMAGKRTTHEDAMKAISKITGLSPTASGRELVEQSLVAIKGLGREDIFHKEISSMLSGEGLSGLEQLARTPSNLVSNKGLDKANLIGGTSHFSQRSLDIQNIFRTAVQSKFNIGFEERIVRDVIGGQVKEIPVLIGKIPGVSQHLYVPLEDTGFTYSGDNLTSRYITRKLYDRSGKIVPYSEAYTKKMAETLASSSYAELEGALGKESLALFGRSFKQDESMARAAIWQLPEEVMPSGALAKARLTYLEAAPLDRMEDAGIESLIENKKLYPFVGPGAAGAGVLTTNNIPESIFGDWGRFMTPEQRPGQFIRGDFGATIGSKERALNSPLRGTFGKYFGRLEDKFVGPGYGKIILGGGAPMSEKAYTAPKLWTAYALTEEGELKASGLHSLMAKEEGYIKNDASSMLEVNRVRSKLVSLEEPFTTDKRILDTMDKPIGQLSQVSIEGTEFGTEVGTGRRLSVGVDDNRSTSVVSVRRLDDKTAEVFINEKIRVSDKETVKIFGPGEKHLIQGTREGQFEKILNKGGIARGFGGQYTQMVMGGEILQRNQGALLMQQTEALGAVLGTRIDRKTRGVGIRRSSQINKFLVDPVAFLGTGQSPYEVHKNLFKLAKQHRLSSREFQGIFGATDSGTLSKLVAEGVISEAEADSISKATHVFGLSKGRIGDLAREGGALKRGSIEQSAFGLMAGKGEIEQRLAAEFATRLNKRDSLTELDMMLESAISGRTFAPKNSTDLAKLGIDDILRSEGRYIDLGRKMKSLGGSQHFYLPGTDKAPGLMSSITDSGSKVNSPVIRQLQLLKQAIEKKLPEEEIEKAGTALRLAVGRHVEAAAAARGELIGSVMLTARSGLQGRMDVDKRIGRKALDNMFNDLLETAVNDKSKEFITSEYQRALRGEVMHGAILRSPATGPYSMNTISYAYDPSLPDEEIYSTRRTGSLIINNKPKQIDISPSVGTKTDFDADREVIAAISDRDTVARLAKQKTGEISEDYGRYLITHNELKDQLSQRRANELVDITETKQKFISGIKKLRAPASTGIVNLALQKAKMGLILNNPEEYKNIAPFLFHLEEASIGGKHGVIGKQVLQDVGEAMRVGGETGVEKLTGSLKALFGEAREITGELTTEAGQKISHSYKYDPEAIARATMDAYNISKQDIDAMASQAAFAKGKTYSEPSIDEMRRILATRQRIAPEVGQAAVQYAAEGGGLGKELAHNATAIATKARAAGKAFWNNKWPLAAGAAVAGGLMLMAPSGAGTVPAIIPPRSPRNYDGVDIPSGPGIIPPSPGMTISPTVYDMGQSSTNSTLHMSSSDLAESKRGFITSAQGLGGGGRGRITIRDDRRSLDANQLANNIHERL